MEKFKPGTRVRIVDEELCHKLGAVLRKNGDTGTIGHATGLTD